MYLASSTSSELTEGGEMLEGEYATAASVNDVIRKQLEDRRNRELQVKEESCQ